MESFLSRYRNLSVLLLLVVGQLMLLAYQVKAREDVPLIRVWAVTAVTPLAKSIEWVRSGGGGFFKNYVFLQAAETENQRLKREVGELRLKNQLLTSEIQTADRAKVLAEFRAHAPSKTLPVRVIGTGTGANSRVVYVDRGSADGVKRGMAAIVPEGIVGRVIAAYPTAALVQLITEPGSIAGVVSQKNKVRGTLKGNGADTCVVDYVQNQEKLDMGEWFYTTGADRVFPKGLPVGQVKMVRDGRTGKEIVISPSGLLAGIDEMLIVIDGVHGLIPEPAAPASTEVSILAAPPAEGGTGVEAASSQSGSLTDADRLKEKYRKIGESQGIDFGGTKGRVVDFNKPVTPGAPGQPGAGQAGAGQAGGVQPPAAGSVKPAAGGAQTAPAQPAATGTVKPPQTGSGQPAGVKPPAARTAEPGKQ